MVMEVLPPEKARRQVERRACGRGRSGRAFRFGKRAERADKAGGGGDPSATSEGGSPGSTADVSFGAYVAGSVAEHRNVAALERDFSVVQSAALGAGLQLDRCWGTQAQALTFTLPLARGLAPQ